MRLREALTAWSKGDDLSRFWRLFRRRAGAGSRLRRALLTVALDRSAHRHGGYVGSGAVVKGEPTLPHGLHGVYISRYAVLGSDCWIYQNVTIGEVNRAAPRVGDRCLIGAGAVLVGGIRIGDDVRIGAGAVVSFDVPDRCTVVAQPPRVIERSAREDG